MIRFVEAPVFRFPYGTLPEYIDSYDLWPKLPAPKVSFVRTVYEDMPAGYDAIEPIVAHYREDVPHEARRLLVFENGYCMVPWIDEFNPCLGYEAEYLKTDAPGQFHGVAHADSRYPHGYQTKVPEAEIEEERVVHPVAIVQPANDIVGGTPTGLAWGQMAPSREFLEKVVDIADEVGTDPSFLLTQFWGESGFNPQAHLNSGKKGLKSSTDPSTIGKSTIGGGLFGLMRQWAKPAVGIDFDDFIHLEALGQLEYARKFYLGAKGKLRTMNDVFIYTFYPAALGKKDSYIIARKGDPTYDQNKHFDTNKDGTITKGEASATRYQMYLSGMKDGNRLDMGDLGSFNGRIEGVTTSLLDPRITAPQTTVAGMQAPSAPLAIIEPRKQETGLGSVQRPAKGRAPNFRVFSITQVKLMLNDILDLCCQDLEDQEQDRKLNRVGKKLLRRMSARLLSNEESGRLQLAETFFLSTLHQGNEGEAYLEWLHSLAKTIEKKKKRTTADVLFLFGLDHVIEQQETLETPDAIDVEVLLEEFGDDASEKLDEWEGILEKILLRSK